METLAYRPKGPYLFEAEWKALYFLTKHWASDLSFFGDDLKFFHHLLNQYFMWLFDEDRTDTGTEISRKLEGLNLRREALVLQTQKHLNHLGDLIEDPFKYDSLEFRNEHAVLEEEIAHFVKDYRACKKQAMQLSKTSLGSEEFMNQLND